MERTEVKYHMDHTCDETTQYNDKVWSLDKKKTSEYDQKIPESQSTDQSCADPEGGRDPDSPEKSQKFRVS